MSASPPKKTKPSYFSNEKKVNYEVGKSPYKSSRTDLFRSEHKKMVFTAGGMEYVKSQQQLASQLKQIGLAFGIEQPAKRDNTYIGEQNQKLFVACANKASERKGYFINNNNKTVKNLSNSKNTESQKNIAKIDTYQSADTVQSTKQILTSHLRTSRDVLKVGVASA